LPREIKEPPYTAVELAFFDAIDRLAEGKPRRASAAATRDGKKKKVKINMTTIAVEAGYARTYLYKNNLTRVMARIEKVTKPQKAIMNTKDLTEELIAQRINAHKERDLAIDAARKWMQLYFDAEKRIKNLEHQLGRILPIK
jgi:hypothetical protein